MLRSTPHFSPGLAAAWLAPALLAVVALIASESHSRAKRRRVEVATIVLSCAYVAGIDVLMLWPLEFRISEAAFSKGNFTPLRGALSYLFSSDPIDTYLGRQDLLAQVLLFAPLGLLLAFVFAHRRGIVVIVALALVVLNLETVQGLVHPTRLFDIDQVISRMAGGILGAAAAHLVHAFGEVGRFATR